MKPLLEQWKRIAKGMRMVLGEGMHFFEVGDVEAMEEFVAAMEKVDPDEIVRLVAMANPPEQATGAEIRDFWDHGWPGDDYYLLDADAERPVTDGMGNFILLDREPYDLSKFGPIVPSGGGDGGARTFAEVFLEWKARK